VNGFEGLQMGMGLEGYKGNGFRGLQIGKSLESYKCERVRRVANVKGLMGSNVKEFEGLQSKRV